MICTSIQNKTFDEIMTILDDPFVEMAEIRLDRCKLTEYEIDEIFGTQEKPLIATCRAKECRKAERLLEVALLAGARYIDLEIEAPVEVSKKFRGLCEDNDTQLIRSFHDFNGTPDLEYLKQVVGRCYRYGADIVKIVTTANSEDDAQRVLSLYESRDAHLVAFAMGECGRESRIQCLAKGAPFSYAAVSEEEATAPGQWSYEQMHERVHGGAGEYFFRDDLQMPASKSFAQRAIIAAALADGVSHLRSYSPCSDSEAAIKVAKQLGAKVRQTETASGITLTIQGIGPIKDKLQIEKLHTGESGLLTRLMIPLSATICENNVRIEGEKTLLGRPLNGAADIMAGFGVTLQSDHAGKDVRVPLTVNGPMIPGTADIPGQGGSQLISGLLMALPLCNTSSRVYVDDPKSIPYMFITLDVLQHFGVKVKNEMEGDAEALSHQDWSSCNGITFNVRGGQQYHAADFDIEGDWSAAANFLVAGAIYGHAEISGLDTHSLQADISILDVLVEAGAAVAYENGDSIEDSIVSVRKAPLEDFDYNLSNAPDIFPIVSVLAAFCPGTTYLSGVNRLRSKESDRAEAIVEMLTQMGVKAEIDGDIMFIDGESYDSRLLNGRLLKGGEYTSRHDHRMVMALEIAAMGAESPIIIDDKACVEKSFPDFYDILD